MKNILGLFCVAILALTSHAEPPTVTMAAPNPVDPAIVNELVGDWKNQMGSTLSIASIDQASGKVDGTYTTATGAGGAFPLIGWVNTKPAGGSGHNAVAIAWTVRWGQIGSITSWGGVYGMIDKTVQIVGQWNLSRPNSDYEWDHILAGQDRFTKVKK